MNSLDALDSIRAAAGKSALVVWHGTRSEIRLKKILTVEEYDDCIYLDADQWRVAIPKIIGIGQREMVDVNDCEVFLFTLYCGRADIYQIE